MMCPRSTRHPAPSRCGARCGWWLSLSIFAIGSIVSIYKLKAHWPLATRPSPGSGSWFRVRFSVSVTNDETTGDWEWERKRKGEGRRALPLSTDSSAIRGSPVPRAESRSGAQPAPGLPPPAPGACERRHRAGGALRSEWNSTSTHSHSRPNTSSTTRHPNPINSATAPSQGSCPRGFHPPPRSL
jgi:hypothetical protein